MRLYHEFNAAKTYGKQPEVLESMIPLFTTALAKFPWDKIEKAFDTFAQRSDELPTRFDIVNLIKRNGKPPLQESQYIAIMKKDGEYRTPDEWQYIRDYDNQRDEGWSEYIDPAKQAADRAETKRLREEIQFLRDENMRLGQKVIESRAQELIQPAKIEITADERQQKTIDYLKSIDAPQSDIEEFMRQCGH